MSNVIHLADIDRRTIDNPKVWQCGCGCQEWFLCADGDAVCTHCRYASAILRVQRLSESESDGA